MTRKLYILLLSAWLFCGGSPVLAQKQALSADIKKCNTAFEKAPSLNVEITYLAYKNYSDKTPVETYTGSMKTKGQQSFSKIMGQETITNTKLSVSVNTEEKLIVITKPQQALNPFRMIPADSLLKICSAVKLSEETADTRTYELAFGNTAIELEKLSISFNLKTGLVTRMIMYYREPVTFEEDADEEYFPDTPKEKPRVEIQYKNTVMAQALADSEFSEKKIISRVNKKYQGIGSYKGYQVIDQTTY